MTQYQNLTFHRPDGCRKISDEFPAAAVAVWRWRMRLGCRRLELYINVSSRYALGLIPVHALSARVSPFGSA
jgi:hypothetical protein